MKAKQEAISDTWPYRVPIPEKEGYYIRWRLPELGPEDDPDVWIRTPNPTSLKKAMLGIPKIRKMFGKCNAWDFAIVYWDGECMTVVYEDEESVLTDEAYQLEYNAEPYN